MNALEREIIMQRRLAATSVPTDSQALEVYSQGTGLPHASNIPPGSAPRLGPGSEACPAVRGARHANTGYSSPAAHQQWQQMPSQGHSAQLIQSQHAHQHPGHHLPTDQHDMLSMQPQMLHHLQMSGQLCASVLGAEQAAMRHRMQHVKDQRLPPEARAPKIVDKNVPSLVEVLVPEAGLYKQLIEVEELLDRESAQQAWHIDDALRERPSVLRTLRICVCNTHKNQPAMRSNTAENEIAPDEGDGASRGVDPAGGSGNGTPEWTLHILGETRGFENQSQKLSDFLEKVEVKLPEESMEAQRHFVWTGGGGRLQGKSSNSFKFTLAGINCDKEFEVDIVLWCRQSPTKYLARNPLFSEVLGLAGASTRDEFVQALWMHIKGKRLHDPRDIAKIKLDDALKDVLKCESFQVSQIAQLLDGMLIAAPTTQVHIKHRLGLSSTEFKPTVTDVTVSVESERAIPIYDFSESLSKVDTKLEDMMQQIATKKRKRDFFQACAESPVVALRHMLESILSSVQELKRHDFLQLPPARPLRAGPSSQNGAILEEECFSVLWDWPGHANTSGDFMGEHVAELLRRCEQKSKDGVSEGLAHELDGEQSALTKVAQDRSDPDLAQQPKCKKQKKGDELPGLDPTQALQNLMMRGPKPNPSPQSLDSPLTAGRSDPQTLKTNDSSRGSGQANLTPDPVRTQDGSSQQSQGGITGAGNIRQLQQQEQEQALRSNIEHQYMQRLQDQMQQNPELRQKLLHPQFMQLVDHQVEQEFQARMHLYQQQQQQQITIDYVGGGGAHGTEPKR